MTLRFPDGETEGWEGMHLTHIPLTWTTQEHMSRALRKLTGVERAADGKLPEEGGTWHASGLGRKKEAGPRIRQGSENMDQAYPVQYRALGARQKQARWSRDRCLCTCTVRMVQIQPPHPEQHPLPTPQP